MPTLTVKYIEALERRVRAGEKVKEFQLVFQIRLVGTEQ